MSLKQFVSLIIFSLSLSLLFSCRSSEDTPTASQTSSISQEVQGATPNLTSGVPSQAPHATSTSVDKVPSPSPDVTEISEPLNRLSDLSKSIFMSITDVQSEMSELSLLSADGDKTFSFSLSEVAGYFWMNNGNEIGLLESDIQTLQIVNLTDGNVAETELPESTVRFLPRVSPDSAPGPIYPIGISPEDENFLLVTPSMRSHISFDNRYLAELDFLVDERQVLTIDLVTDQTIQLTDPSDGVFDLQIVWSPTSNQLAVVQGTESPIHMFASGDRVTIYEVPEAKSKDTIFGDFSFVSWSPSGEAFLYRTTSGVHTYSNIYCILDLQSGSSQCLDAIANSHPGATIDGMAWLNDGDRVVYICNHYLDGNSDICTYNFQTGVEDCPTQGLEFLDSNMVNVEGYSLSPDDQIIVFTYGDSCPRCDFWGSPSSGILILDGEDFFSLGQEILVLDFDSLLVSYPYRGIIWKPVSE